MSIQHNEHKRKRLTADELKKHKGFENYTDEQAEETISTLEKLSVLFYELYMMSINDIPIEKQTEHEVQAKPKNRNTA